VAPEHIRLSSPDTTRSAGLCLTDGTRVLLLRRAGHLSEPGTWTVPGGHLKEGEKDLEGAYRETREEVGYVPPHEVLGKQRIRDFMMVYAVVEESEAGWKPLLNEESTDSVWADENWIREHWGELHPGMRTALSSHHHAEEQEKQLSADRLANLLTIRTVSGWHVPLLHM
jgi:8-oxo-dGTP pyrophosphatase MutT (NUDIX family)